MAAVRNPDRLLDNLITDGKAVPMIVVMPNGRAQKNDRAEGNVMPSAPAFAKFEGDLLGDVIPFIESTYSVQADREHRALAGLDGWRTVAELRPDAPGHLRLGRRVLVRSEHKATDGTHPDPERPTQAIKLLYLSCGNKDGLIRISQGVHAH